MATNLNITANSTSVSSNNFSITVTDNNTGNVVNISPPTSPIVSISAAGILGNPGKDSNVVAGESVIFQHITASGEISASGIVYGSQINIGGGIFTSASLAAAEASGDNLGNHTATQNLNLNGNSLLDGLNITASGNISSSGILTGDNIVASSQVVTPAIANTNNDQIILVNVPEGIGVVGPIDAGGDILSSGNISASGNILAGHLYSSTKIRVEDNLEIGGTGQFGSGGGSSFFINPASTVYVTGDITATTNITASGNISSSGIITAASMSIGGVIVSNAGGAQFKTDVKIRDGFEFRIGDGPSGGSTSDMALYHDGTNSYIKNNTGELRLEQRTGNTVIFNAAEDGEIQLILDEALNTPVNSGRVLISGSAENGVHLDVRGHITASGNISASGNLNAANITTPGTLTVEHLEATTINTLQLTSSIVTSSIIFSSGSNIFGDEISDTHTFNGHITASGNISSSGNITAITGAFSYLQGNSPLTMNPDQLIITPNDYFQVLTGDTTSSIFISQSSGNIGFNTNDPQTGFDVIVNEAQFQQPGTRTGLKINDEGNIESFSKDATTAATGSEFVLRYSRGVSITKNSLSALNIDVVDDASATQYFNSIQPKDQNVILEKLEILGFITPPQINDVLGSIRFLAESGSSIRGEGYDDRTTGETAAIKAVVSDGDSTGIQADMIFSVAGKTGAAQQKFLLDANGSHQMTGSLFLDGVVLATQDIIVGDDIELTSDASRIVFGADGDTSITHVHNLGFLINTNRYLSFRDDAIKINSAADGYLDLYADTAIRSNGNLQVEGNVSASGDLLITNITASNNISASALIEGIGFRASGNSGFGGQLHVGGTTTSNFNTGQIFKATGTSEFTSHITASGNISSSGNITADAVYTDLIQSTVTSANLYTAASFEELTIGYHGNLNSRLKINSNITSSGNISASGDLMVNNINGTINGGTF